MATSIYDDMGDIKDIDDDLWNIYQKEIADTCAKMGLTQQEVYVNKGDTIIWHPLLAHGGAPYRDLTRTRLSFVIHTTPDYVPVFHTDVFFNPEKRVVKFKKGDYRKVKDRLVSIGKFSIGHGHDYDFEKLV
jgi:phytanoyl-CoA hydroxylase